MSMERFEEAEALRVRGEMARAYSVYDELAWDLKSRGAVQAQAEMIRLAAGCLHEMGRIPEAQNRREEALSLTSPETHNEIVYGALLGDLGRGYLDLQQLDKARPWILKAIDWAKTHNLPDLLLVQTLNLGLLECRQSGYHGPGKGLLEDSLKRALQAGDLSVEALARLNLGLAAFDVLLYKEAAEHLLRAQEIGRSLGLPLILRESEEGPAKIQLLRNPDSQSFQALNQMRKINQTNRDRARKAGDILALVQLGQNQGKIEEALGNYQGAAAIYMELINTLEEVRQHLLYDDLRENFFASMNDAYMEIIQRIDPGYSLFSGIGTASSSEIRSTLLQEERFLIYQAGETRLFKRL